MGSEESRWWDKSSLRESGGKRHRGQWPQKSFHHLNASKTMERLKKVKNVKNMEAQILGTFPYFLATVSRYSTSFKVYLVNWLPLLNQGLKCLWKGIVERKTTVLLVISISKCPFWQGKNMVGGKWAHWEEAVTARNFPGLMQSPGRLKPCEMSKKWWKDKMEWAHPERFHNFLLNCQQNVKPV